MGDLCPARALVDCLGSPMELPGMGVGPHRLHHPAGGGGRGTALAPTLALQTAGYLRRASFGVPGPHSGLGQLILALGHLRALYVSEELRTNSGPGRSGRQRESSSRLGQSLASSGC